MTEIEKHLQRMKTLTEKQEEMLSDDYKYSYNGVVLSNREKAKELFARKREFAAKVKEAELLRTEAKKSLAKKRLYPIHGEDWEKVFQAELKRAADISSLELQLSQMDSREIAEWIYELQEKVNEMV